MKLRSKPYALMTAATLGSLLALSDVHARRNPLAFPFIQGPKRTETKTVTNEKRVPEFIPIEPPFAPTGITASTGNPYCDDPFNRAYAQTDKDLSLLNKDFIHAQVAVAKQKPTPEHRATITNYDANAEQIAKDRNDLKAFEQKLASFQSVIENIQSMYGGRPIPKEVKQKIHRDRNKFNEYAKQNGFLLEALVGESYDKCMENIYASADSILKRPMPPTPQEKKDTVAAPVPLQAPRSRSGLETFFGWNSPAPTTNEVRVGLLGKTSLGRDQQDRRLSGLLGYTLKVNNQMTVSFGLYGLPWFSRIDPKKTDLDSVANVRSVSLSDPEGNVITRYNENTQRYETVLPVASDTLWSKRQNIRNIEKELGISVAGNFRNFELGAELYTQIATSLKESERFENSGDRKKDNKTGLMLSSGYVPQSEGPLFKAKYDFLNKELNLSAGGKGYIYLPNNTIIGGTATLGVGGVGKNNPRVVLEMTSSLGF